MTIKFTKIEAANNKNSAIWEAKILDQVWRFQVRKYWGSDTAGGSTASCCECWRVSGGNGSQKLTASSRKRAVQVIKSRIENHVW